MIRAVILSTALLSPAVSRAANSLSLGADYLLRGVTVAEQDKNQPDLSYYDQSLSAYLITDLSKDVEATVRVKSTCFSERMPHSSGKFTQCNSFPTLKANRCTFDPSSCVYRYFRSR